MGATSTVWETVSTLVDIEDESQAHLCNVTFSFAMERGVIVKDLKESSCKSETNESSHFLNTYPQMEALRSVLSTLLAGMVSRLRLPKGSTLSALQQLLWSMEP